MTTISYYYKASFSSTYAMIGHKSHSAIITTKILIDVKDTFAPSLTYVILSKITNQANLKIVGTLTPNNFTPCNFEDD
jgi:ascorbate-specific PTS system EIIC-type component UlaA